MSFSDLVMRCMSAKVCVRLLVVLAALAPQMLQGQDRVIIIRHESTPEGDIIRAGADAALLLKQAELVGEKANAQRLQNMMTECNVRYKQMRTRQKTGGTLETKFEHKFDVIRFNQQLADIRRELEQKALMQRTRIGDPTDEMNSLLEKFARQSINANRISAMKTELTAEQLDAIFLTDGANTFSGKTGKTKLEAFKWPFLLRGKDFQEERDAFDAQCDKVVKEIDTNGCPSPETIMELLERASAITKKIDALPLSDNPDVRAIEGKWRREAKAFMRELTQTLGNSSKLDSEKLAKYAFQGKTLGELIDHLDSKGLRFSHPGQQDVNLYASIFLGMRYAYQEFEKGPQEIAKVYLDDLNELEFVVNKNDVKIGKYGDPNPPPQFLKFAFQGHVPRHALYMVPPPSGKSYVIYVLNGKYRVFSATPALGLPPDAVSAQANKKRGWRGAAFSPITFRVLGDGKLLWESRPIQKSGDGQACEVAVQGIEKLELQVVCSGSSNAAWALWVEPFLTVK
jgi:hypothetical protein